MKNSLILSFAFLFLALNLNAQQCGNVASQIDIDRLLANKKAVENGISVRNGATIYVAVTFHIVRESDGTGGITEDLVAQQLCSLNEDYAPLDIVFYLKDKTFNYINSTSLYTNPTNSSSGSKMALEKNNAGKNSVNVFICENADTGGLGTTLGYYDPNLDLIVMRKSEVGSTTGTLAHEAGHFFSLLHVFNGWDQQAWNEDDHGNPVSSQYSPGGVLNELADGSNCATSGDFLCDTPADYNLGFSWSGCSTYGGGCKDYNGEELNPQEDNYMSYFIGCSQYVFSEMQKDMVIADYNSPARTFLKVGYEPNIGTITETVLESPADDEVLSNYNIVELDWEKVDNAIGYVVSLRQFTTEIRFLVEFSNVTLTNLLADKVYNWRVMPISEIGGCQTFTDYQKFRTGLISTTEGIELESIELVSTLLTDNQLSFKSDVNENLNISLYDISGNTVLTTSQQFYQGQNQVELSAHLINGMYFVRVVDGDNKAKTFKVVVNN